LHVFHQIFLETSKFPNKKGTFDINLVFTATLSLALWQKWHFSSQKWHFWSFEKMGGGGD
jgi:hypothetical protein